MTFRIQSFHGEVAYIKLLGRLDAPREILHFQNALCGLIGSDYRRIVVDSGQLLEEDRALVRDSIWACRNIPCRDVRLTIVEVDKNCDGLASKAA
jgi:hypothetical protein